VVNLSGFVQEFFKETSWRNSVPNPTGSSAGLEGEQDLVLADGVELGEIPAEAGA